jgi:hypothetical protein
MILCYCHENIPEGVALLSHAAKSLHAPSMYALALILRDCRHTESNHYLDVAASLGYAPAWQEKLTPAEMRARFGDLDANALLQYMDPPCLNSLLGRHYLECSRVRRHQTSHCWNPLCGRWAFKALRVDGRGGGGDGDAAALRENIRANQIRLARLRAMLHEQNEMMNHRDIGEVAIRVARLRAMMHEINDIHRDIGEVNNEDGADHHQNEQLQRIRARHDILEPMNVSYRFVGLEFGDNGHRRQLPGQPLFSIEPLVTQLPNFSNRRGSADSSSSSSSFEPSPLNTLLEVLRNKPTSIGRGLKVSRMKMCSSCRRAKYCSKLCQVLDWRSGKHKMECQFL